MTAIESLPAYREAEVAAKRRGENLGSLIDAFLAGYAGRRDEQPRRDTAAWRHRAARRSGLAHAARRDARGKAMSLTIAFSSEAKRDLKRLYRRHPSYADELLDMLHDEVRVQGRVPRRLRPSHTGQSAGGHTAEPSSSTSWMTFS